MKRYFFIMRTVLFVFGFSFLTAKASSQTDLEKFKRILKYTLSLPENTLSKVYSGKTPKGEFCQVLFQFENTRSPARVALRNSSRELIEVSLPKRPVPNQKVFWRQDNPYLLEIQEKHRFPIQNSSSWLIKTTRLKLFFSTYGDSLKIYGMQSFLRSNQALQCETPLRL